MSTPSGKPFDPFDLSPYAPKRARERSTLDGAPVENDDNDAGEEAAVALPYVPRAAMRPQAADENAVEPDAGAQARPRPDAAAAQPAEMPAAAASAVDPDLARLESSLQWLQREGAVGRLPRAAPLPPVTGLRPVGPDGARPRGEQFINGVRVPPSLAPERLRPPPLMRARRDNLRGPLRILMASAIAAAIAYYFSVGNFASSEPSGHSALASFAARLVASNEFPVPQEKLRPGEAEAYNTVVSSRNKLVAQPTAAAPAVAPVRVATVAVAPPSPALLSQAPDQAAPAAAKPERELDAETIKLLLQQGEQFVASGDVVTARQVYRRAAEAGSAAAALALGATYDPVVLAKIGVHGMGADIEKARSWYEKAKEFGSPDAPRRLEMLANR
jgi:TPR repeat protein